MASELRVNYIKSRSGLGTVTFADDGVLISGIITASSFSGSGANLTSLNADNLSSGTVPAARITSTNALTVGGDLYVTGNISFAGTTTQLNTSQVTFSDPDIVLGVGTTSTFNPADNTANHGGIAVASTEGSPLVNLNINPNEILPITYKKFMWFKNNAAGLGTDAWLSNYAVGIGSTQFPTGTRFASGNIQFDANDAKVIRHINASGIVTATEFDISGSVNSLSAGGLNVGIATATSVLVGSGVTISSGIVTATGGFNIGISSAGTSITSGPITRLNFVGTGNTFAVNGTTVDISISGGGGGGGSSQWVTTAAGINTTSSVGIGTTNPLQKLHVLGNLLVAPGVDTSKHITLKTYETNNGTLSWEGTAGQLFSITNNLTTGSIFSVNDVSGVPSIDVNANGTVSLAAYGGNVGVGKDSPTTKLDVNGTITCTDINSTSDIKLKDNIQILKDVSKKINQINGVSFNWKEDQRPSIGVIAQDIEKVFPELVTNGATKTVNYNGLIGVLIEVVKEQQSRIELLEKQIKNLN